MALHPSEAATLQAFVVPAKRKRMLERFGNPKRREQACDGLNHFADWDERYEEPVDSSTDLFALLRRAGAPPECRVISDSRELDGRDMELKDALEACEEYGFGSVLCCVPGRLAFYFDEMAAPRNRILLRRPDGPKSNIGTSDGR